MQNEKKQTQTNSSWYISALPAHLAVGRNLAFVPLASLKQSL